MEDINLGGNITLSGFKDLEPGSMFIIKKMVGNYVKRMSEKAKVQNVTVNLKRVHGTEDGTKSKFEMSAKLVSDKIYNAEHTDFNLFVATDKVLAKILHELGN